MRRPVAAVLARVALLGALGVFALPAGPSYAGGAPDNKGNTAEPFVAGFEDLPLMPGLTQIPDVGVVFDTPSGRIVEAYAEGPVDAAAVLSFYARTLPQLGWRRLRDTRYQREGEALSVDVIAVRPKGTADPGPGAASGAVPTPGAASIPNAVSTPGARVTVHFYLSPG